MKNILKKISATLAILAILGMSTASAGVSSRDGQLMANSNFEAGYTAFTDLEGVGSSVAKFEPTAQGSLALRATYNSNTAQAWVYTTAVTITATDTAGYNYRIKGMARGDGTLAPRLTRTNSGGAICASLWEGTASTDTQYFDVVFSTSSCSNRIGFDSATNSAGWVEFDNVSITRYYGTVQNRELNGWTDGNMEQAGTTNYFVTNGTLSKEAGASDYMGTQVLRVTWASATNTWATNTSTSITPGVSYRIRGWARGDGTRLPTLDWASASYLSNIWTGTGSSAWQRIDVVATAPATATTIRYYILNSNGAGQYTEWDNMSITRYYGTVKNTDRNLVVDNDSEAVGVTAWTVPTLVTVTKEVNSPINGTKSLRIDPDSTSRFCSQTIMTVGDTYRVKGKARTVDGGIPRLYNNPDYFWIGTNASTEWQYFDEIRVATSNIFSLYSSTSTGGAVEFDDLSVTAVRDNNYVNDSSMELAGTTYWTATGGGTTISKQSGSATGVGSQVLRLAFTETSRAVYQNILDFSAGTVYRVKGYARGDGTNAPMIDLEGIPASWQGTSSTTWQPFDFTITGFTSSALFLMTSGTSGYVEWDDVTVTRVY
jgi:hypothetical protein